jgi:hypothetical protein
MKKNLVKSLEFLVVMISLTALFGCGKPQNFSQKPAATQAAGAVGIGGDTDNWTGSGGSGLLACPNDGNGLCTPWVLTSWDTDQINSGYMRARTCPANYDCRTIDHNGACTPLNPGGALMARYGTNTCGTFPY